MKFILVFLCLFSLTAHCFASDKLNSYSVSFDKITGNGYVVIYVKSNPVETVGFSQEFDSTFVSLHKFKDFHLKDLKFVFKPEKIADYKVKEHESIKNSVSLLEIATIAPSKKECSNYVKKLKDAIKNKDANCLASLYFSTSKKGINPDFEINMPNGASQKISELLKLKINTAKSIQLLGEIFFWRGKNFAMISGTDGKIRFSMDGEEAWIEPIYIFKRSSQGKVEIL